MESLHAPGREPLNIIHHRPLQELDQALHRKVQRAKLPLTYHITLRATEPFWTPFTSVTLKHNKGVGTVLATQ